MAPLILAVAALMASAPAAADTVIRDLTNTKIIRSHESPHNIINEACIACHPKDKFDFWILIYKGKSPTMAVEAPEEGPAAAARQAAATAREKPKNRYNSHEGIGCNFCHYENPTEASPKFIVEVRELCRLCHPATAPHNLPDGAAAKRVEAAIVANRIPGAEGKILCTTCHKLHKSTYGMREAYFRVLWEDGVPNPHGKRSLCFTCHPGAIQEGAEIAIGAGGDDIALCNGCHTRVGIKKTPHVFGVPSAEGTWRMDYLGFPLKDGKLTCVTCHDEVSHRPSDPANPRFLRGGPYDVPDAFCYKCHIEDRKDLKNPHNQVDAFGRIREEACRYCHPAGAEASRRGTIDVLADETSLCVGCHPRNPHPTVDHIRPITADKIARKQAYEIRHKVKLPLADDGQIKCSTCHNPHAKGVLKDEAGVGGGSRYRVPDFKELCAPCHGRSY